MKAVFGGPPSLLWCNPFTGLRLRRVLLLTQGRRGGSEFSVWWERIYWTHLKPDLFSSWTCIRWTTPPWVCDGGLGEWRDWLEPRGLINYQRMGCKLITFSLHKCPGQLGCCCCFLTWADSQVFFGVKHAVSKTQRHSFMFKVLLELKGGRAPHHQFFRLRFDYSTTHRRRSNVKINTSFYGQRLKG